ncbi:MAG: pseudaminic acid synthase [Bdellovibrionota bacterium]
MFIPKDIKLGRFLVGSNHEPFIIAEMSGNHGQSLDNALKLVEIAAKAGVQALKLQTYTAETMTLDLHVGDFVINDPKSLWNGRSLFELYEEAHTPWEWHKPIFEKARELGLECFSTPFDKTAVDFLEEIGCSFYKIASFENTDHELLKAVARTGKPIIMSTGTTYLDELVQSVDVLRQNGCEDLILLKCTSTYPADPKDSNLLTIPHMKELFRCHIGLSDHTLGIGVPLASIPLGSVVIEKHFTMSRADETVDSAFSLEPDELKALVDESTRVSLALGKISYQPQPKELNSRHFKRSLFIVKDVKAGEVLTEECVRSIRPGTGLPIRYLKDVIGCRLTKNATKGMPVTFDLFR